MLEKCDVCNSWIKKNIYKVHITKDIYVKGEFYGEELVEFVKICEKCKNKTMKILKGK